MVLAELRSRTLALASGIVVVVAVVAPIVVVMWSVDEYSLTGPADVFELIMRKSPLALVFPLVAALPYAISVTQQISHRYLVYTRPRENLHTAMRARFIAAGTTGFLIAALIPFLTFVWSFIIEPAVGIVVTRPEAYGLASPEQVRAAELEAFTFAQLLRHGDWAFGVGYSLFVGVVGALFAVATVACLFMMTNRFLAMATPWIVNVTVYFVMAILQLELVSPNAFFPFNLTQSSMLLPFIPLGGLLCAVIVVVGFTFRKARSWDSWQ